jgi:hypothetical protein
MGRVSAWPPLVASLFVGAADSDGPVPEIDVLFAQARQLALAKAGVDGAGEEVPVPGRHRLEHRDHFVRSQEVVSLLLA